MKISPQQLLVQVWNLFNQLGRYRTSNLVSMPIWAPATLRNSYASPQTSLLSERASYPAPIAAGRAEGIAVANKSWTAVICDLVKVRLTSLVLLTTLVGFYMGTVGALDYGLMLEALIGTTLVACGASALNQLWEREHDAKMRRTADRPLPSGRMRPDTVLLVGTGCSVMGLVLLAVRVNMLTSLLGAITLAVYVFIYTPLKRVTWLNTLVGAIPGGLPPLIGWAAAQNEMSLRGLSLFAIMFCWQIAHFLAIAWLYRDDYSKAGFVMLSTVDPDGRRTGRTASAYSLGLLGVSVMPVVLGLAGSLYLGGALILGVGFAWFCARFARQMTLANARYAFYASIIYLPMLLILLVLSKG